MRGWPRPGRRGRCAGHDRSRRGSGPRGDAGERRRRAAAGGAARRGVAAVRRHGGVLAVLAGPVDLPWALARGGEPLGDHAQADDLCPDRGAGRGADGGAARAGRRRTQLGLPLHLGPRCVVLGGRAAEHRVRRGGGAVRGAGCAIGSASMSAARAARSTSCTGSTGRAISRRRCSSTGRATAARARCGSATAPPTSCSSTSTARRWTASSPATGVGCRWRTGVGRGSATSWTGSRRTGTSPRRASGRPAAGARRSPTGG